MALADDDSDIASIKPTEVNRQDTTTGASYCDRMVRPHVQSVDGLHQGQPSLRPSLRRSAGRCPVWPCRWGGPRRRTSEATRRAPYRWDRETAAAGERRQVFCMSLGDFWDNQVPDEWRIEALNVIRQCRNLDWLILTKRPQNILKMLPPDWGSLGWSHVWLGATVENMVEARRRIPILLRVPARVHWLSVAPLLEPLDLRPWLGCGIDWIVVGGETGAKNARYMEPDWARDLRDQCQRHRCRALSQADVEAASDPCRSDGARISGALIGLVGGDMRMLNLRGLATRFGFTSCAAPTLTCAAALVLPVEPRPSPASPPVP